MTIFESQWLCLGKMLLWLNCLFWGLRAPLWGKVSFLVDKRSLWKALGAPENFQKKSRHICLGLFLCVCVQMFVLSFFCVFVYMFVFTCFCVFVYMFVLACHNLECLPSHCQSDTPLLIRPPSCLQLQQLFSFSLLS